LGGVKCPWLRQKLGISVSIQIGAVAKLLAWQQKKRRYFVLFMMNISGAKFEELL